ncbi:MAG: magnesium/cobalt transporter CorA [Solirubrobacteraceae bacterium]
MSPGEPAAPRPEAVRVPCLHNPNRDEVVARLDDNQFVWIDYEDPSDEDISELAKLIKLHPLTREDAHTFRQRPKIEDYEGYMFMVVFGVDPGTQSGGPLLREVHIVISGDYVVTIHRRPFAALSDLRIRYDEQQVRSEQFLVYKILDAITTTFIPVLTRIDDDIDELEQDVIADADAENLQRIFSLKRDLVAMRRVVTPMRDMFIRNADRIAELPGLETDDRLYFRDLYDGLVRVSELVDSYRDLLSGATDMYLSTVANRQGEINKQLTIIATIFLPLTFVTGLFGQNFASLVRWISAPWVFYVFGLGLLVLSVVGFAVFFRRKGWL